MFLFGGEAWYLNNAGICWRMMVFVENVGVWWKTLVFGGDCWCLRIRVLENVGVCWRVMFGGKCWCLKNESI